VKTMDETPIRAGRSGHSKMQTGYFWPVYGEEDEVCFPFHLSRSADFVSQALGLKAAVGSVLLTDGYAAYERYAKKIGITHAQCWAHSRRGFFEALGDEPSGAASALEQIKAMYAVEEDIRDKKLAGEAKQIHRLMYSKPLVEYFFDWVDRELARQGFTPSNPYIQALNYVRERRQGLEVFLTDPDVPIGRVDDWRGKSALQGVAVVRRRRCLSLRRISRFQSPLVEPDKQISRIRLSCMSLRPSLAPRRTDSGAVDRGRVSRRDTRRGTCGTRCLSALAVGSAIAADAGRCRFG